MNELVIEMQRAIREFGKRNKIGIKEFSSKCIESKPGDCDNILVILTGKNNETGEDINYNKMHSFMEIARMWNEFTKEEEANEESTD
jgi:hypothetical protein